MITQSPLTLFFYALAASEDNEPVPVTPRILKLLFGDLPLPAICARYHLRCEVKHERSHKYYWFREADEPKLIEPEEDTL